MPNDASAPIGEWLAIRTDRPNRWINGDAESATKAAKDLRPRNSERAKSAWAFVYRTCRVEELLQDAGEGACLDLQALALLIFLRRSRDSTPISVKGVAVERRAFSPDVVTEERASHIVAQFDSSHRHIFLEDDSSRVREAARLLRMPECIKVWERTTNELLALLEALLHAQALRPEFVPVAQEILSE